MRDTEHPWLHTRPPQRTEHFDVLIVGAGISGIGAAYHLTKQAPDKRFVVLEAQESFGGTWLTHKYPGIRSDSDLYTFGYRFKPWIGPPIATAAEILQVHGRGDRGERPRPPHPLRPQNHARELVERREPLDRRGHPHRHRRGRGASPPTSSGCARATTATTRATRPSGRAWPTSRAASSTRRPGRTTSTTGQDGRRDRLGRHRRDADPRRSPTTPRTSPCCSARRPTSSRAATSTTWPTSCAIWRSPRSGSTRSCAASA